MSWWRTMAAAGFASLGRGRWWLLALAAFLVRGGLLLALLPILILPTPAQLEDLFVDPDLVGAGLATPTPALVALVTTVVVVLALTILGTSAVGGWLEGVLVDTSAEDEELAGVGPSASSTAVGRIDLGAAIVVRLAAHIPTGLASIVATGALATAVSAELASPGSGGSIFTRIVARAAGPIVLAGVAWLLGETWGGIALRRLRADGTIWRALGRGLRDLVRPSGLATLLVGSVVALLPLLVTWYAAGRAFGRLSELLVDGADPGLVVVAMALLVATWAASLWLLAIGLTWRSVAWTAEVLRHA